MLGSSVVGLECQNHRCGSTQSSSTTSMELELTPTADTTTSAVLEPESEP